MYCNGLLVSSNTTWKTVWDTYDQYNQYDERTLRYLSCSRDLNILTQITKIPQHLSYITIQHRKNIVASFHNIIQKQAAYGLLSHSLPNIFNILRSRRIR